MLRCPVPAVSPWRALVGALAVLAGVVACSGIITGPDAPDLRPRSITVTPSQMQLALGDTSRIRATLYDATGAATTVEPGQALRYISSDSTIARVDGTGLVTALADGTVNVRAEYGALGLGIAVQVLARPRLEVVSGNTQMAEQGDTLLLPLVVRARNVRGQPASGVVVTFTVTAGAGSLVPQVDTTDAAGLASSRWVLGLPIGVQTVAVTAPGNDSTAFTATAIAGTRPARVAVTSSRTLLIGAGDTTRVLAQVFNVANVPLPAATIAWASSALAVATVTPTGLVTAVAPGTVYIKAIAGAVSDSILVTVQAPPSIVVAPDSIGFVTAVGTSPANANVAITNGGGGQLTGMSASIAYGPGASDWLDVALDSSTAPLTMPITATTAALAPGDYTATITIASTLPGVVARAIQVTLRVTGVVVLPKLDLGPDRTHPAWLQDQRQVTLPATALDPVMVTIRTLDPGALLITSRASSTGTVIDSTEVEGGTSDALFWIQGIEGAQGRTATIIAEADGYEPDTAVVTLTRPAFRLSVAGAASVPAVGGEDPILLLSVGDVIADVFIPLAVSVGSEAPIFTLTSQAPSIGLLRFFSTAQVTGADQGPATQVTFGIIGGTNTTSSGQFVGTPANVRLARTGTPGVVQIDATGSIDFYALLPGAQYTLTGATTPIIVVAPDSLAISAASGSGSPTTRDVAITNGGVGTLSGLSADVLYGAGASDWISVTFDSTTAPTTMRIFASAEFLAPGTYTATVTVSSGIAGVAPLDIPVVLVVTGVDRIVIVSGNGQQVRWGDFTPDSLKVRVLRANGQPLADAFVNFAVSLNGGTVSPVDEVTDNDGYVATRWLMGDSLGTYTVTASRSGFVSAVFTGTSVAGSYVTRVAITAPRTTLTGVGDTVRLAAATFNRADSLITTTPVLWASTNAAVVTVNGAGLVTAVAAGSAYVRASVDDGIDSVLVTVGTPLPVGLSIVSGDGQSATVGSALAQALVVRYVDAGGTPVSGASIRYQGIYGCCSPFVDSTVTTDASGVARMTPLMPTNALPVTVTVSVVGAPAVPTVAFTAAPLAGPAVALAFALNTGGGNAGVALTPGWTVRAVDQYANVATSFSGAVTMTLSNGPTGITTLGGTSTRDAVAGVVTFDDLTVNVASSSWVLIASATGVTSAASAAFSITIPATLSLVNTPLVGVNGTATMRVVLGVPAYGAGLTVALVSSNTGVAVVNAPASVIVPAGQTTADFTVSGVSTGTTFITATVDGTSAAQTSVTVSTNTISVPLTLNLPFTRTASLPINLPAPAPVGGITINVASGNPAIVSVLTPTVFIPQGGVSGNAQIEGLVLGQATVTATGPNLATGTSSVTVTAALDLIETSVSMNAGFSTVSLTTRLLSGGTVFPAPAGGIPLTFVSRNAACVAAPASLSVAVGLNSVTTSADYGGTAPLPCTTRLVVSSPSFDVDSVQITVNSPPTTSFSLTSTVAAGLSRDGILFLGTASPAGGTSITISSSDPTRLVVAPNSATVGAASVDLNIPPGGGYIYFTYAAIEDQLGSAVLTATVNRYSAPTPATITLDPLGLEASGTSTFTLPGADGAGTVSLGSLGPAGPSQSVSGSTIVRAGGQPIVVTLTSTNPAAVVPVVGGVAASPSTVTINPGQASATYGLRPLAAGTTTITATAPTATAPVRAGYPATLTVTQATTSLSLTPTVAAGLSRDGIIFLGAASPPGGTVIRLTSSDPTRLVLAPNSATIGTASIDVTVPAGSGYSYFTYAAMEGAANTTATISGAVQGAPAAYADPTPVVVTIDPLGLEASGSTSFTMPGADGAGTVYIGSLGPAGPSQSVYGSTMVRAGGQPIVVTLTSTTPATAVPVVGGIAASPATVTINPGQTSASYALRPLAAGTTTITASAPTATAPVRANYPATITVSQATTSFSVTPTVAAGLSRDGIIFLGAGSPAGGTVIRLTSSDPSRLVLAPNATTVGTATIDVTIAAGNGYSYFTYAAIEGQAGTTATISAVVQGSPPAYSNPTPVVITIDTLGVELSGSTTITTLGSDGSGTLYLGSLGPAGPSQSVYGSTIIRAGGPTVEITLTSTTPTVAVPVVGGVAASPRTITLGPGQSSASFGIRPLVAGTTTITAASPSAVAPVRPNYPATITVNSPSSSISLGAGVGAGLTMDGIVFLQVPAPAGGATVRLTSSDPSRLLVAPNATTAGATQVDIVVPQGTTYTYFTVMGLEDITGNPTVTAQTSGYTDATASVAVLPIGVQWTGITNLNTLAPDGGGTVYIGVINGVAGNRTVSPSQAIRFGGVARTITMTSSDPAVALPVVGGIAQQGLSVTLLPGSGSATVGVRAMGAGTASFAPSGPGLIAADAPGYPTLITVTVPNMTLSFGTRSQGAGLSQEGIIFLGAGVPAGGSRTLTLTSNDPTRLLLAPNTTTNGASQITFEIASGTSYTYFTVMGLEGASGSATVSASITGYRDSTFTFTLVQPAVTLDGPAATRAITQGDVSFQAQVGVPSGQAVQAQVVRFGAPSALTVSLSSSAPTIGTLVINGVANASQTVTIPIGASLSSNVVSERVNFRPLAAGNTTVTATVPGYVQQGNAIRTVTVTP